jgi:hypothetical protein
MTQSLAENSSPSSSCSVEKKSSASSLKLDDALARYFAHRVPFKRMENGDDGAR